MSETASKNRKWMYLIVDSPHEDYIGNVSIRDSQMQTDARKNERGQTRKLNRETGETYVETVVGMGYHDFEDEEDYEENIGEVMPEKLAELEDRHLESVGVNPAEFGGFEEGGDC